MGSKKKYKNKTQDWFDIVLIVLVGLLLFYPPYFQGLFFEPEIFIAHILTAVVFIFVWLNKFYRNDLSLFSNPLDFAILAYVAAYALSLLAAVIIGEAVYGLLKALNYFLVYWIITQAIKDNSGIRTVLKILLLSGLGVTVIGILAATGLIDYPAAVANNHISSTMGYHNALATYLSVLTLLGVTLLISEKNLGWQIFCCTVNYLMLLVTLAVVSKGAWIILIFGFLLLVIGLPRDYRLKVIYFFGLALGSALIVSNYFMASTASESPASGIWFVLAGLLLVLGGWLIWRFIEQRLELWELSRSVVIILICVALLATAFAVTRIGLSDKIAVEISEITDTENLSYVTRVDFMRWGAQIAKDHPVVGTGAGGWEALYRQYQDYNFWTTETHSHIFQVWVEAGTIGLLAFISMWIIFFYLLYRLYIFHRGREDREEWILIWGIAAAAMGLGLHSCFDFDLSMPGMVILLWSLLAMISVYYNISNQKKLNIGRPWINVTIASILVLILLLSAAKYLLAYNQAQSGQQILQAVQSDKKALLKAEQLNRAAMYFSKAVKNDPQNAGYWSWLATLQGHFYLLLNEQGHAQAAIYRQQSIIATNKALDLNPYDPKMNQMLMQNLASFGDLDGIIRTGELLIKTLPNDPKSYKVVAQLWWDVCQKCEENGQHDMAIKFAREIDELDKKLLQQISKVNIDHPFWQGEKLNVTPECEAIFNQAEEFLAANKGSDK